VNRQKERRGTFGKKISEQALDRQDGVSLEFDNDTKANPWERSRTMIIDVTPEETKPDEPVIDSFLIHP
jgi:hypothetical protein